jgi:hypothetical protein
MSMKKYEVISSDEVVQNRRKSPMHAILESIDGDYWIASQVAAHMGVHTETIRRLSKATKDDGSKLLKAPSSAVRSGKVVIYLYDHKDVKEIENHFIDYGYQLDKRIDMRKPLSKQVTVTE